MTIHLSGDREQIVRSFIQQGAFTSEEEVIDEALRLLLERDEQAKLAALRRDVAIGIEQADRGELSPFDPYAALERIRSREVPPRRGNPDGRRSPHAAGGVGPSGDPRIPSPEQPGGSRTLRHSFL